MKKFFFYSCILILCLALVSWGKTGHKAIGLIAGRHLNAKAAAGIKDLLGDQSLSDVSTYADEIRSLPQFKTTGSWHYINLPLGLSQHEFDQRLLTSIQDNVYTALIKCERDLISPQSSRDQKIFALKFIVHLVGDLHQPMHVSRSEDQGGNTIQLNFNGEGTNLHRLWDSGLIEKEGLTVEQIALNYDKADVSEIKRLQRDPINKWMFESYQLSSALYTEVDSMKTRAVNDQYYSAHLPIIHDRIEKAGIRLAGILNALFSGDPINAQFMPGLTSRMAVTETRDATVSFCDKVYTAKFFSGSQTTLLNLGAAYPDETMTVVIKGADRSKFKITPEIEFLNKTICVTGKQIMYKGKKEIVVTDTAQIVIKP